MRFFTSYFHVVSALCRHRERKREEDVHSHAHAHTHAYMKLNLFLISLSSSLLSVIFKIFKPYLISSEVSLRLQGQDPVTVILSFSFLKLTLLNLSHLNSLLYTIIHDSRATSHMYASAAADASFSASPISCLLDGSIQHLSL